jgi:hypothetical protein
MGISETNLLIVGLVGETVHSTVQENYASMVFTSIEPFQKWKPKKFDDWLISQQFLASLLYIIYDKKNSSRNMQY